MKTEFIHALVGGLLIGIASLIASAATGKIPGISGVLSKLFVFEPGDTLWRGLFLLGLIAGATGVFYLLIPGSRTCGHSQAGRDEEVVEVPKNKIRIQFLILSFICVNPVHLWFDSVLGFPAS